MATLNIDQLVAPISEENPTGPVPERNSEQEEIWYEIGYALDDAQTHEKSGDLYGVGDPSSRYDARNEAREAWQRLWDVGQEYLTGHAKDLAVVGPMMLAAPRVGGIGAFAQVLSTAAQLVERYWDDLQPMPNEDEGLANRVLPLNVLDGPRIEEALGMTPVTTDHYDREITCREVEFADFADRKEPDEQRAWANEGKATLADLAAASKETPDEFYAELAAGVQSSRDALDRLHALLSERLEEMDCPTFQKFRAGLDAVDAAGVRLGGTRYSGGGEPSEAAAAAPAEPATTAPAVAGSTTSAPTASGTPTREDALSWLEQAAAWFEQHEPQSFMPFEIRKAARRARMSPEELYKDLITDDAARTVMFKDIGLLGRDSAPVPTGGGGGGTPPPASEPAPAATEPPPQSNTGGW